MRLFRWTLCSFLLAYAAQARILPVATYQVHIRPQLINIQQDIQQILLTFPFYSQDIFSSQTIVDELQLELEKVAQLCPKVLGQECLVPLNRTVELLKSWEALWFKQESKTGFTIDASISNLSGKKRWLELYETIGPLLSKLQVHLLAIEAKRAPQGWTSSDLRHEIDDLEVMQDLVVIDSIPGKYQDDFRSAWLNFFRPLQRHCLLRSNRLYLATNLDQLNFYWNLLNMKLTKRLKRTPEGMSGPLNAIHNRWNQVMRVSYGL